MTLTGRDIEIMAPAGSYESLSAAMQGGADAVYFGVGRLNMRSRSSQHFTFDDLYRIVDICRQQGVKSYLALNTVIYDDEMEEVRQTVDHARVAGVSAIIASDIAVMRYAREQGVRVHISTQCNITNMEAVRFYSQYGDVMVLARELTLEQVHHIACAIVKEAIKGPNGNVCSRCPVHGRERQVLPEPRQHELFGQPGLLFAAVQTPIPGHR